MQVITLSAAAFTDLASAAAFAGKDKDRPLLTAVMLERDGRENVRAIATDSYGLITIERGAVSIAGDGENVLLSAVDLASAAKLVKGSDVTLRAAGDGRSYEVVTLGLVRGTIEVIEGAYPDYRKLIPGYRGIGETEKIGLDPALLVKLTKVAPFSAKMGGESARLVALSDSTRPIMFESRDGLTRALFMPVRAN
jgi:DNA polymerase III sliding clamp (beta) subunit (PCNA family)